MEIITASIQWLTERYNLIMLILVVLAGSLSLAIDAKQLQFYKYTRESAWAKGIGLVYIVGGIGLWVILQLIGVD